MPRASGILVLLLIAASVATSRAWSIDLAQPFGANLIRSFELIALRTEYGNEGWAKVRKWREPVRVYMDSRVGLVNIQKKLVEAHLANLRDITGHDIRTTPHQARANTHLIFDGEKNLRRLADELMADADLDDEFLNTSVCFAAFYLHPDSSIRKAIIVIPVDRARAKAKLPTCIIEELTQVMGLVNDSDEVFPSIFNDKSIDEELSFHDVRLLQLLYNPRVKAGMTREEVIPIIEDLSKIYEQ